jgi:hypothetical protein
MKREAEIYLEHSCPHLDVIVVRPGLVTDWNTRPASLGMGFVSDSAHFFTKRVLGCN